MTIEVAPIRADTDPHLEQVVLDVVQAVEVHRGAPVEVTTVREVVDREWARYRDAPVRTFVPVLVRRAVMGALLDGARPPGSSEESD